MLNKYVDLFYGNGAIDLPKPVGIAATWFFIKAQCGNTHPHASLPFGKMSCGLYTGGYPSGYGNHCPNSCGPVTRFDAFVRGFSHLHQTGTGGIGAFYNYAVTGAVYGDIAPMKDTITSETAKPGYYCAALESGIKAEVTADKFCAIHRYHLKKDATITIDFTNDGLNPAWRRYFSRLAEDCTVKIEENGAVSAVSKLSGIPTYFYAVCEGTVEKTFLFEDYKALEGTEITKTEIEKRLGAAFSVSGDCVVKLAISHKSIDEAKAWVLGAADFEATKQNADAVWETYLSKIEIEADEETKEMFYSNFYHSILKPSYYEDDTYIDFATLWDIYKTQLPFVYSLYKDEGRKMAQTLVAEGKKYDKVPTGLMIWDDLHRFDDQAQMLSVYTLADAYYRGLVSGKEVIEAALKESKGEPQELLNELLEIERYTHILDLTEACGAAADIAKAEGDMQAFERLSKTAAQWPEAFNPESGILKESTKYYEGNSHSYSFRLQRDMDSRMKLCGSVDKFVEIADSFFGYGQPPVEQCQTPDDAKYIADLNLRRFDGINNEHDLESMFVYLYAGRHDRLCEVVRGVQKYMFTKGRGGLPGNNDTGALSCWYMWNALGIFPVTGQNKMLVSNPLVTGAKLSLSSDKTFTIKVVGEGDYVDYAELNGVKLEDFTFSVTDMMNGGELVIKRK